MGLQNQLTDVSSESIPVFVLALIANAVCYLRSLLQSFGFNISSYPSDEINDALLYDAVGSGTAGLILLSDQLNLNRLLSYRFDGGSTTGSDCVVCLNRLSDGENVRKLACHHVFHKECFEGWLDHLNFNCPLCRSPLVYEEHVGLT